MKKRRRSDRKKYQAEQGFNRQNSTLAISNWAIARWKESQRKEKRYGVLWWRSCKGLVLHVTGNSYRWEKA